MPFGVQKDDGSMFAEGDRLAKQRMVDETQRVLHNTQAFLESIHEGDAAARNYVEGLKHTLEGDLRRLKQKSPGDGEPPPEPAK